MKSSKSDVTAKMAELLRSGATMLSEHCPVCGLPLFRLRSGEIICPIHGRVYVVRDESEASRVTVQSVLEELERVAASKIAEALEEARKGVGISSSLKDWLDVLERAERILGMLRQQSTPQVGVAEKRREERRREQE